MPELLEVASFTPAEPPILPPDRLDGSLAGFRPGVDDFALYVADAPTGGLPGAGPRIVLVLEGRVEVRSDTDRIELARGEAAFVGDDEGELELAGDGRVAVGAVPL